MKYTTKTSIEIMTEEDKPQLIPFMESIKQGCNVVWNQKGFWVNTDVKIGELWYIHDEYGLQVVQNDWERELITKDYTILKGVPQNWREESEIPTFEDWFENLTRTESDELEKKYGYYGHDISTTEDEWLGIYNDEFGIKQNKDNSISISKLTETNSRLDQLESENKELRQVIKNIISCTSETFAESIVVNYHSGDEFTFYMTQAKQLLEK